jgi:hypothetical protein
MTSIVRSAELIRAAALTTKSSGATLTVLRLLPARTAMTCAAATGATDWA